MTIQQAIEHVEAMLAEHWQDKPEHGKVRVYTWGGGIDFEAPDYTDDEPASDTERHPAVGFRVAEVSFSAIDPETRTGGGSSFMQSDGGGEACFYAERAVISRIEEWPPEEVIEDDWRLLRAVHGDEVARAYADGAYQQLAAEGLWDLERGEPIERQA